MKKYDWKWLAMFSGYIILTLVLIWLTISSVVIGFGCVENWNLWVILWHLLFRRK